MTARLTIQTATPGAGYRPVVWRVLEVLAYEGNGMVVLLLENGEHGPAVRSAWPSEVTVSTSLTSI
jgi:hypothetical protein